MWNKDLISPDASITNLFFTKPGSKIPIIRISVTTTVVQLDKYAFSISILGIVDETETENVPFPRIDVNQLMNDYKHLNPLIKEGISHRYETRSFPNRTASRSLVVSYRMFEKMYEEDEDYGYDINEEEKPHLVSSQIFESRF